jgi:hypothetical protein
MTAAERTRFVRALLRMKRDSALTHNYDQYPTIHDAAFVGDVDSNPAHLGPAFCPWHRYFLARFEQDLQTADRLEGGDGRLMLPYWDWVNDDARSPNRQRGQIWHEDFMGGSGTPVRDGPFRDGSIWAPVGGGALTRELGLDPDARTLPRRAHVDAALRSHGFDTFPYDDTPAVGDGLASPAAPRAVGASGGSLAAGVYQVVVTYVTGIDRETRPSPPTAVCVGGGCTPANAFNAIAVTAPARPPGALARGYRVYVSPVGGAPADARLESGTTAFGTPVTVRSLSGGAKRPATNTTSSFRNQLEGWVGPISPGPDVHNRVHVWVGGSMAPGTSPDDPVFFLHHCNIDRIWALWQQRNPGQNYPEVVRRVGSVGLRPHGLNDAMPPWTSGAEVVTAAEMLDHTRIVVRGRPAGYTYDTDPIGLTLDVSP